MALPRNVTKFSQEMSPESVLDWYVDLSRSTGSDNMPLLEPGEAIATFSAAVAVEAFALGVRLGADETAATPPGENRAAFVTQDGKGFVYFVYVIPAEQAKVIWNGTGVVVGIEVEISTTSIPPREFKKTFAHTIAIQ